MNILIADKFPAHWIDALKADHKVTYTPALDENTLASAVADAEVLIVRSTKVNKAAISAAPALKLIIRAGAGYDTIDTAFAKEKNIGVCTCPATNSIAVAELAIGLMLALDRRICDNVSDLRQGKWNKNEYSKAKGIYGSTMGILGLGNIGKEVNKRAQAFGMKVIACDPTASEELMHALGVEKVNDIYTLAAKADVISVHLPGTPETNGVFNKKFFDAMKPGATFINTSRGSLVNTADLIEALKAGKIKAGVDVYEKEPKADDKTFDFTPFEGLANFYGTHHIGASTDQAQDAVAKRAVDIVKAYAEKKEYLYRVN